MNREWMILVIGLFMWHASPEKERYLQPVPWPWGGTLLFNVDMTHFLQSDSSAIWYTIGGKP